MADLLASFTEVSVASNATLAIAVPATIPAGRRVILALNRATTAGAVNGVASIADAGGNTWTLDAASCRASTHDLAIWSATPTAPIPSGSTITVTWHSSATRKAAVASVWSGLGARSGHSGQAIGDGGVNTGANGSSLAPTASTGAASGVVIGASTIAGTATSTPVSDALVAVAKTAAGSSDRGVMQQWRLDEVSETQTASATLSASQGWAACAAVYALAAAEPMPSASSVAVAGVKRPVVAEDVVVAGVKRPVVTRSVVVDGTKIPLT